MERHIVQDHENLDVSALNTMLAVLLSDPAKVEVCDEGPFRQRLMSPGDIVVIPAGTRYSVRCPDRVEFMVMSVDSDLISRAARAVTERDSLDLRVNWGFRDPFIRETFSGLAAAVESRRPLDRIYGETLANSLAMHLARNCKHLNGHFGGTTRGLSRGQLERVMDYIHCTPYSDISLQSMADAAGLSPFHFSRMFKGATGLSPHQYVLRRRIGIGAEMLLSREEPIASIALELGFADQSHFTMHFKRIHGVGPAAYRRHHRR